MKPELDVRQQAFDAVLQQAFLDGATMAYQDVATQIRKMVKEAPESLKGFMEAWSPFADACETKIARLSGFTDGGVVANTTEYLVGE